jgi:putative tryptophan/tyrosine transport system substrate-binding protein
MNRREFIAGLGGSAARPVVVRAQQRDRVRRLGILWPGAVNDSVSNIWHNAFVQGLSELGWIEGRNLHIDVRWHPRDAGEARAFARELIDLHPDVLVTGTVLLVRVLQQETHIIPIVMNGAGDPVVSGLVKSLSRPEGNTTGVTDIWTSLSGRWLELLREAMPSLARIALVFNPDRSGNGRHPFEEAAEQAGVQYGVKTTRMLVRNVDEIESAIPAFAAEPNGGLMVLPPPPVASERETINRLAIRYRLPVSYQDPNFVKEGGLLSYGADFLDMSRHDVPAYADRILRGAKPGDLPVQFPSKFRLVVNLKTAKAMGLTIPESFLVRADEVIE